MFAPLHQCPKCHGFISREHAAIEDLVTDQVTYLYCDFCGFGLETLWHKLPEGLVEKFTIEHRATRDPVDLGKFLQRLHDARAA